MQGEHAAQMMMGNRKPFAHLPYFFSDVFDLSWECWGDIEKADQVLHRGNVQSGSFSTWWLENGKVVAVFVLGRPDEEREAAQAWIRAGETVDQARLSDAEQSIPRPQTKQR